MSKYTKLGVGDATPDYKEDSRPQCKHCLEHFNGDDSEYCSPRCVILDNVGEYKEQILCWINQGMNAEKIIEVMEKYEWFYGITDASVARWKLVIINNFRRKNWRNPHNQKPPFTAASLTNLGDSLGD